MAGGVRMDSLIKTYLDAAVVAVAHRDVITLGDIQRCVMADDRVDDEDRTMIWTLCQGFLEGVQEKGGWR